MTLGDVGSRGLYLLGLSPRLEVVLLCWELCLVRRDEAESPGELSALGWEQQRPLSRVAGSQDRPSFCQGQPNPGSPAQLCSPCMNQGKSWGQRGSVPLLDLTSFSPRSKDGGE